MSVAVNRKDSGSHILRRLLKRPRLLTEVSFEIVKRSFYRIVTITASVELHSCVLGVLATTGKNTSTVTFLLTAYSSFTVLPDDTVAPAPQFLSAYSDVARVIARIPHPQKYPEFFFFSFISRSATNSNGNSRRGSHWDSP